INARLSSGLQVGGGVDTGRTVNDVCFNVDSPGAVAANGAGTGLLPGVSTAPIPFTATTVNGQPLCRIVTPFKGQTQLKAFGSYTFPKDFVVSLIFQNISGPQVTASYAAPNAIVAPSLGRSLAGGARTATVPLVIPQSVFEDRYS